jgi:hypothetical protein
VAPLDFKSSTASDEGAGWVRFPHPPASLIFQFYQQVTANERKWPERHPSRRFPLKTGKFPLKLVNIPVNGIMGKFSEAIVLD